MVIDTNPPDCEQLTRWWQLGFDTVADENTIEAMAFIPSPPPDDFPWKPNSRHNDLLWYALMTVENGKIKHETFKSSGMGISELVHRLRFLDQPETALLFAVWHREYFTNVHILEIPAAISRLENL